MPFSMRIPDIKRYGVNEILEDDVTVVKNFFEISMSEVFIDKPKTYRFLPIVCCGRCQ